MVFDNIIIGAGLYGLYAALRCAGRGDSVLVLECDAAPFSRATYINQARVHMGYHYPRSLSTAIKSRAYFDRFNRDYDFCVNTEFDQIYATSANFSWTNAQQFCKFCADADIRCEGMPVSRYFKPGMCDGAFLTTEYTYDAQILKEHLMESARGCKKIQFVFSARIAAIERDASEYSIRLESGAEFRTGFILNATYAGVNQIHRLLGLEPFKIKYELCEIILCTVSEQLRRRGITVMDGPFFSIMPFGKTGLHSLTSVAFTPHVTSYAVTPTFACQSSSGGFCTPDRLGNCNNCPAKPQSSWPYMSSLARKYLRDEYRFEYVGSLFSMKPILMASEIDDSRPTVIREYSKKPTFVSVLSGKINTIYDLDEVLEK